MVRLARDGPLLTVAQLLVTLVVVGIVSVGAFIGFVWYPSSLTALLGVVIFVVVALASFKLAGKVRESIFPTYNVAEIPIIGAVHYPGGIPSFSLGSSAEGEQVVEQIERADRDGNVEALLIRLNTTGGEMAASEDILAAINEFDGPTVAYIDDWCASAGYWIAVGCDEIWAHYGSMVGSIGVQMSQVRAPGLASKIGLEYENISSGTYKNALGGTLPIMPMENDERELLQKISDGHYNKFVQKVVEHRDIDEEVVRNTDGAFYRGEKCVELNLIDEVATRQEFERSLADRLGVGEIEVKRFESGGFLSIVGGGSARAAAVSLGTGIGTALASSVGFDSKPR